jgi:hypothetical protein
MAEARIISRLQLPKFEPGGMVKVQTQLTYIVGIQPPRTIFIDNPNPTDEEIAEAIRADQAQPGPAAPKTIQI